MVQYDLSNSLSGNSAVSQRAVAANSAVSQRVVAAVADARDVDPLELPPLYDTIDPDALDQLFARGSENGPGRVIFVMAGCEVMVHSDGEVDVTAPGERESTASAANPVPEQDKAEQSLD